MAGPRPAPIADSRADVGSIAPLVAMAFVVVFWAIGPVITKLITAPPMVGAFYRFLFSLPFYFTLRRITGRRLTWSTFKQAAVPGAALGINMLFVFAALQEVTVAVLSVAISMQPALVLVVAGRWMNERITAWHVGWTLVGVAGAVTVILGAGDEVSSSALGIAYAFGAVASFTVYFLVTRSVRAGTDVDPIEWMSAATIWAVIVLAPPALLTNGVDDFREFAGLDWLWLLLLIIFTGIGGHVLMGWVHGHIEATRSSLYMLLMHPLAVGLAWPVHDEPVTLIQVAGGVVVLGAVAAVLVRSGAGSGPRLVPSRQPRGV